MMKQFIKLSLIFISLSVMAEEKAVIDHAIRQQIKIFNLHSIPILPKNPNRAQVELGRLLFSDTRLSGNNRVSCQTCHTVAGATSDSLPMSRSEDGKGILRRNTPNLFNVGAKSRSFMFWDGRVHFDAKTKIFKTPESALNGVNPKAAHISSVLTSALSAQALFPIVAENEMKGRKGENDIADAKDNLEAWDRVVRRLKIPQYNKLFQMAYPNVPEYQINIGHVAEAIGAFEREEFQAVSSPFQRYLRGDNDAMTHAQKRGFFLFMSTGKCIVCHNGGDLGNSTAFASAGTPQWSASPFKVDLGRAEVTGNTIQKFFFRIPSLINVAKTAPYMHNGAFQTLSEVIKHYDYVSKSINIFEISNERQRKIPVEIKVGKNPLLLDDIWLSTQTPITPELRDRLFLTKIEMNYIELFLKEALTDSK
ncbi:MAG: cytochrome c peroxidase [Bacteriovorax sp.]